MAAIEETFRLAMLADPTVAGFLGDRIYLQAPQNPVYPFARVLLVSDVPLYTQERDLLQGRMAKARLQVDVWGDKSANSATLADQIADAISDALQTFNAWQPLGSPVVVGAAPNMVLNRRSDIEARLAPPVFRRILDISIWHARQT